MSKYRSTGQLDDPQVIDGDTHFVGLDQVNQPTLLGEGQYQVGENIRLKNGKVVQRGGLQTLALAGLNNSSSYPSQPLDLIKYQNPRTSILIKATMSVPTGNGTAEIKVIARSNGNVIWNHQTFTNITGSGIPTSTISVNISGNVLRYNASSFPNQLFEEYPNLEISVYLVSFTTDQLTGHDAPRYTESPYRTGEKKLKFWSTEPDTTEWEGSFYYTGLEGWGNHTHDYTIKNNLVYTLDKNFGTGSNPESAHIKFDSIKQSYEEYQEFDHFNATLIDIYDPITIPPNPDYDFYLGTDHRFLPSKWSVAYTQSESRNPSSPLTHLWTLYRNGVQEKEFLVQTGDNRHSTNSEFVAKLREMYAYIWENTPEYSNGYYTYTNTNDFAEGGVAIPVEVIQSEDEDILVVMKDRMSGVFTEQTAFIDPPYTDESEVTAVQCFDQAILFSSGYRPKTWDGEQLIAVELSNTPSGEPPSGVANFACPAAPFGVYVANKLVVPHYDDSTTSVAFSDIFELNNFFETSVFRANRGTSDITLAMSVYAENQLLVFNRNSIHIINNVGAFPMDDHCSIAEITRQYGVAGHKAMTQNGAYHYFISSEGDIQVLVPSSDPAKGVGIAISKVTLDQLPLSKPIQETIDKIDRDSLPFSIAHYHRNKVYFAFGIDRPYPNTIAVYDSLRSQFISIDTFGPDVNIKGIQSIKNRLFVLANDFVCEYETDIPFDKVGLDDSPIISKFKTRDYRLGTNSIKKFTRGSLAINAPVDTSVETKINTTDPDTNIESQNYTTSQSVNEISRFNISNRGYSANVELELSSAGGRDVPREKWEVSNISLEGYETSRQTGSYS